MRIEIDDHKDPADCTTMAEVRQGVDALDRALVALLVRRQGFMDAAARIKPHRGVVRDEARIEDVVAKVRAAAREAGLSEAIAEPVWRTLIDRCIAYEFGSWDRSRTPEGQPLEGVLRD
ncbi:chorismate mutase [Phenylobacterium sp.]|uniref:chorismate mutase n=1 Tax=Phenylobacterium sp. TaxID=1871053 RepID=UPI0008AFF946|nr:chorismate mutase [Phenylobacterium sp.]MBA4793811.1 chorismate mutase [Phenylobacterium sp.]MBC7167675.1 chorismate mutase [Phenylobacterium sp.]OHB41132.1 MAG: chorismate mutase [Phenylobacterium sp. RIFCSPHIGHO2_01_FULL_70_10]